VGILANDQLKTTPPNPAPFTEAVKTAIQFIDHGIRGYYCAFAGPKTPRSIPAPKSSPLCPAWH
jgi:hypothetical protein